MKLISTIVRLAGRQYSAGRRLVAIAFEALVFVLLVPGMLAISLPGPVSAAFAHSGPGSVSLGACVGLPGLAFALWTVSRQHTRGHGTPVPVMATQRLLRDGPYAVCRNPMALGTLLYYLGFAIALWHWRPLAGVALIAGALIVMIRTVEEKEVAQRFGAEYLEYRRSTPFLIPHLWRK